MQISAQIVIEGNIQAIINSFPQDPFVHKEEHIQFATALTPQILQHTLDVHLQKVSQGKSLKIKTLFETVRDSVLNDPKYNFPPENGSQRSQAYVKSVDKLLTTFPWETYLQKEISFWRYVSQGNVVNNLSTDLTYACDLCEPFSGGKLYLGSFNTESRTVSNKVLIFKLLPCETFCRWTSKVCCKI